MYSNRTKIRTSAFCAKYPEKCVTIDSYPQLCDKYPEYCRLVKNTTKLLPLNRISQYNLSREELSSFGHQIGDLMLNCKIEIEGNEEDCKGEPIQISVLSHSNRMPFNCYMFYSLYERPNEMPATVPLSTVIRMTLNIEVSEYHPEHLSRGAQIAIHSPYDVPSPMSDGQLLNLGAIYRFYVRLTRLQLLPAPYKSKCRDYMSEWYGNGGKGPITQKMCKEKCKLDKSLEFFGCADRRINYPHNETLCQMEICSMPCNFSRFEFQVQVSNSEGHRNSCAIAKDLTCFTLVQIFLENMEITTFSYRPRFEAVGVLSWIGGYVGLWLGISLLHVYDFIEILVFRGIACLRKGVGHKKKKKTKKGYTLDPYRGAIYLSKMRRRL
ncbi:Degenerin mec-4 like protein [Argiope bruennichi]|uniref:Degenerin mec-4 like protein n=1 Tax=Argiope bruennichi TaxID=94029 RepID=A0A8T0E051_ARGBR|nr:Degenerin mec-4 like protein [Argiope bruennichi]